MRRFCNPQIRWKDKRYRRHFSPSSDTLQTHTTTSHKIKTPHGCNHLPQLGDEGKEKRTRKLQTSTNMAVGLVLIWHFSALIDHSKDLTLQTSFTQSHMHPDKHFNLIFTHTLHRCSAGLFSWTTTLKWLNTKALICLIFFCSAKYVDFENSQS